MSAQAPTDEVTERRGRRWIFGAFVLCPCHVPLTLAALTSLLGGTAGGAALHAHRALAIGVVALAWALATAHGFRLVWHAGRGTCPVPLRTRLRSPR